MQLSADGMAFKNGKGTTSYQVDGRDGKVTQNYNQNTGGWEHIRSLESSAGEGIKAEFELKGSPGNSKDATHLTAEGIKTDGSIKFYADADHAELVATLDGKAVKEMKAAAGKVSAMEDEIGTLSTAVNNVQDDITGLGDRVDDVDTRVTGLNTRVAGLDARVAKLDSKVNRVGAQSAAIAGLRPLQGDSKLSFALGYGNYDSANAVAMGAFYMPTDKISFNLAGAWDANGSDSGKTMVSAGVSFSLDADSPAKKAKKELAKELNSLNTEEIKMLCEAIKSIKQK